MPTPPSLQRSFPPHLEIHLRHRIGTLEIDVSFQITQPWTILFGPSGSGKTTILRILAGLIRPNTGSIQLRQFDDNITLLDTSANVFPLPHQRRIPLAPQSPALFPHRTVREQIAYGMIQSTHKASASEDLPSKIDQALDLFRIGSLAHKYPHALSGGEAQRINLARATAAATHILLLDEPFTGLDSHLRSELIHDLQAWAAQRNLCVLSVTHDIAEAFQLNAEVIKLHQGRIVQQGPAPLVLAEERTRLLTQLNPTPHTP